MRIRLFQHVSVEGPGQIAPALAARGHELLVTRIDLGEKIPFLGSDEGLIVMGGPMSVNDGAELPWLEAEKAVIAKAIAEKRPVLGICLGAQLVASTLGARVYANESKEIGWLPITLNEAAAKSGVFGDTSSVRTVFHWHGETFALPPNATRLASSEACENQAFLYGDNVLGLQFHLEVGVAEVATMVAGLAADIQPLGSTVQAPGMLRQGALDHDTTPMLAAVIEKMFGASA